MVLIKNKRGIFFTTLVIVLLALFMITFTLYSEIKERKTIQKRIETLNNFVFSVEEDIPRQLKATGFRIIFLFEKRIIETGSPIINLKETFREAFFNGTIYGETNPEIETIMVGVTIPEIENSLKARAAKIGADIQINNPNIYIEQNDSWSMKITLESNIIIKDKTDLALWNKTSNISAFISIENFEDPIYVISTNGLITNKIIKSPYTIFVQGADISNLLSHSKNSYYISSVTAPSFLDRLEGINSPNSNGIESLVDFEDLSSQGISTQQKSVVDYIYFSSSNPSACIIVPSGMPSWFRLDSIHLGAYQVSCA